MKDYVEKSVRTVALNVKKYRKEKGKSQGQVAKKLQVTQNTYSKMETGKTKLTLLNLIVIAEYLKVDIVELMA